MKLKKTENGFTLTGSVEELERLQSTAHYAKMHVYHERQVAWDTDKAKWDKIYNETLQLELTLE